MNCHWEPCYFRSNGWQDLMQGDVSREFTTVSREVRSGIRDSEENPIIWSNFQNNVFGTVLLRMGLLFRWIGTSRRAHNYLSNSDCATLRAMTDTEWEGAIMLFLLFIQLLKLCGAIQNFDCFVFRFPLPFRSSSSPIMANSFLYPVP